MLCAFAEPGEALSLVVGWAGWVILDYLIESFIGHTKNARVVAAIIAIFAIGLWSRSCSRSKLVPKTNDE